MRFVDQPHIIYNTHPVTTDRTRRLHLQAYDRVDIWVLVTALNGAPSAATLDIKVQHRIPRENSAWIDITGKNITQITQATSLPSQQIISLEGVDIKSEEVRLFIDVGFTGGTTPSWTIDLSYQGRGN